MSTLEEITIAMSHEDFDTWSTLTVGFNYTKSLVICLTFYDYKNVQHHTYAIIEKDEAMAMSEHLDVKLTDLPQTICKHCGDTSYVFVPSHVEELFKGFHTRLRRTLSHIKRLKITPKYSLRFFNNSGSTFCPSKQKHPDIPTRQIKFVSTFVYTIFANTKIGCDLV